MKICMLSAFYYPIVAGSEVFTQQIAERLVKAGHEVSVITGRWGKLETFEIINGVKVYRVWSLKAMNLSLVSYIIPAIWEGLKLGKDYDLFHAHLAFSPGFCGAILSKLLNKPLITSVQGGDVGIYPESGTGKFFPIIKPLVSYSLKNSDYVHVISNYLGKISKKLGARKVVLVRNGTDIKKFNPHVKFEKVKKSYNISGDPIIFSASRLTKKNGLDYLILAMEDVLKNFPKANLVIAGDGPEKEELNHLIKNKSLEGSVKLLGYVPHTEIPQLMCMSNIFIRPSLDEGLGIVFSEAMACKIPTIGTNVGGIPDMIEDRKTGMLIEPGNTKQISESIKELLTDKHLRENIIKNGYAKVKKEFSWPPIFNDMLTIYQSTLK